MNKLEKEIDDFVAHTLQDNKIDFFRILNSNFKSRYDNYITKAFLPNKKGKYQSCDKFFPDFQFPFKKKIYLVENGIKTGSKIKNQERKDKQIERINYWVKNGNCVKVILLSVDDAKQFFKKIKLMEI